MNKRIICFALAAFLVGATVASAQITGGVKVGVDLANMSMSAGTGSFSADHRTGFMGGGFIEIPVMKGVAIQPEALITMKGTQYGGFTGLGMGLGSSTATMKLTYLDIPVLIRVDVPMRVPVVVPYVYAGPDFGFLLKAQASSTGLPDENIKQDLNTTDVGLAFGGGIGVGRLLVEARYVRGLSNVFGNAITSQGVTAKNTVFKVLGGIRF